MRSKLWKVATLCFILLLGTYSVFASNGTQIGTVGARSTAMGSAFRGLADDWSAVFFNPAGLTQLEGLTIGFSGGMIAPRGDYNAYAYPAQMVPFSGMITGTAVEAEPKNFFVPALGIFKKLNDKMSVGLGVYAPFGLGTEWNLVDLPADYGNATGISKKNESYSDHQVINIQPTFAYQVSDKLSIGIGACYTWGKMDLDMVKIAFNPAAANWDMITQGLLAAGLTLEPLTMDQYRLVVENNLSGTGSAYGVNVGALYNVSEKLALSGDFKQTYIMHGDPEKVAVLSMVPGESFPGGEATKTSLLGVFSGQNVTMYDGDVDADLPLPLTAGIGLGYKASDKLTLSVDVSMTNWASWDVITLEQEGDQKTEMKEDWKNTIEAGAGLEYLAMDGADKQVFVRGGFYTVASPVPDETMSPTILDPSRRYVITGGLGLNMGKVALNLAAEYVLFGETDIKDYVFDYNPLNTEDPGTGVAENYAGIYNFKALVVTLGASISL